MQVMRRRWRTVAYHWVNAILGLKAGLVSIGGVGAGDLNQQRIRSRTGVGGQRREAKAAFHGGSWLASVYGKAKAISLGDDHDE